MRLCFAFVFALLAIVASASAQNRRTPQDAQQPQQRWIDPYSLPHYTTKYYELYTDLTEDEAREVALRMTKVAEVYAERTRGFSGAIRQKFPLVIFRELEDYKAAGGPEGSGGFYNGRVLMAVAGKELNARSWHRIQHEGFHQFAHNMIRGNLPTWVNEGLAEYFGEGLYTGDDIISGVVPKWRLKRIKKTIEENKFKSLEGIMTIRLREWNAEISVTNYDQAWSMVQFLAHGDGGKYQPNLIAYMNALGRGKNDSEAWRIAFPNSNGFEDRWREYWRTLPDNDSEPLYQKATVSTLTGFLARATVAGLTFSTFEDFAKAAEEKTHVTPTENDLPPRLLADALKQVAQLEKDGATFSIVRPTTVSKGNSSLLPQLVAQMKDGRKFVGSFMVRNGKITRVSVDVTEPLKAK